MTAETTARRDVLILLVLACISCGGCSGGLAAGHTPVDSGVDGDGVDDASAADVDGGMDAGAECVPPGVVCDGACVVGDCDFAVTSIAPVASPGASFGAADWLRGGGVFVVRGRGFARGMKLFVGDARAPIRVVDDRTATMIAPPGAAGAVEVRVELGGLTSTTRRAFSYIRGRVNTVDPWQRIPLLTPRDAAGWTVLHDGRLLIAGGATRWPAPDEDPYGVVVTNVAELFDPTTLTLAPTAVMNTRRAHVGVTLLDGRVAFLVPWPGVDPCCGGRFAEIYDPATGAFSFAPRDPDAAPNVPNMAMLPDGRILIASEALDAVHAPTDVEVLDPETWTFTNATDAPPIDVWYWMGFWHLTPLRDGRVLLVTGQGRPFYLFDPETDAFTEGGTGPAAGPDALITLADGRVLAIGGSLVDRSTWAPPLVTPADLSSGAMVTASAAIEVWDPGGASDFAPLLDGSGQPLVLSTPRMGAGANLMVDGTILVQGGMRGYVRVYQGQAVCGDVLPDGTTTDDPTAAVDRIDPVALTVSPVVPLPEPGVGVALIPLPDGSMVGGGGTVCEQGVRSPREYFYFRPNVVD